MPWLLCSALALFTTQAPSSGAVDGAPTSNGAPASTPVTDDGAPAPTVQDGADAASGTSSAPIDATRAATLEAAVLEVLGRADAPARVAIAPIDDDDAARAGQLLAIIARVVVEERLDAVTPKALDAAAFGDDDDAKAAALAARDVDHVLVAAVRDEAGAVVDLRLVRARDGVVVGRAVAPLDSTTAALSTTKQSVQGGMQSLVDQIALAMESLPGETRYQRLAVLPMTTTATSDESKGLARAVERELSSALVARGFLVVERARLDDVVAAREAELDDAGVMALSRAVDAQALVIGSLAATGASLVVSVRVVSSTNGAVLGTATAEVPRSGAIAAGSPLLEQHTPGESLFRSALLPGWGQLTNEEPVKAAVVGVVVGGLAATTVLVGGAGLITRVSYELGAPFPGQDPADIGQQLKARRELADVLLVAAGGGVVLTAILWSANVVDAYLSADE